MVKKSKTCAICIIQPIGDGCVKFCSMTCYMIDKKNKTIQKDNEYSNKIESGKKVSSKRMRRYLINKHGHVCMNKKCAWDFSKISVPVELEHKDGNHENNVLSNCILLCANCHSLTPTYKNKNKGNGRAYRRQRYAEGKSY